MSKFILSLLMMTFGAIPAFAATSEGSEYFHQAGEGKWEVTPGLKYMMGTVNTKPASGSSKIEVSGLNEMVTGEYGISDMFSAGLMLSMGSLTSKTTSTPPTKDSKSTGMYDPVVFFHGKMPVGTGILRYGVDVNMALAKGEIKNADNDTNNSSGGMGAKPFVGYEMTSDKCTFGAVLSYKLNLADGKTTDKSVTPNTESTDKGGEETVLAVFYEHVLSDSFLLGGMIGADGNAKSKSTTNSVTTSSAGSTNAFLNVYSAHKFSEMFTLLPSIRYDKLVAYDTVSIDSGSLWTVAVSGRLTF